MKTSTQRLGFTQTLIALAVLSAFGQANAQEAAAPQGSVSLGGLYVSGDSADRARFGLYNDLREHSGYGLLDFSWVNRDSAAGLWTSFDGRNLFLDTRELNFTTRKLGDWKIVADYNEIIRYSPYTINTGMTGAGTTTPNPVLLATPGTGAEVNLDQHRKGITLAGSKWFGGDVQFEASIKSEQKEGARPWGRGFACSATWVTAGSCATSTTQWALLLLPEPIDSTINQAEAKLTYAKGGLLLTAGYYGNYYINRNSNLTNTVPSTIINPLGAPVSIDSGLRATMGLPMALNPDTQANQLYLLGNYRFSTSTVANFKYAYTHATQNEDFGAAGFSQTPPGVSNLGGEMNTTVAQVGITSRPMPKVSLLANYRYEKREDNTPVANYNIEGAPATTTFTNSPSTKSKDNLKLEGSYLFPGDYRATLGLDWDKVDHGEFTQTSSVAGLSGLKQDLKEQGYRLELRKSMSESLNGFISYVYSKREGDSPWEKPLSLAQGRGTIEANDDPACVPPAAPAISNCIYNRTGIFPTLFEDRKRDKIKGMVNWMPSDQLSVQFLAEEGQDKYTGPTEKGASKTGMSTYSLDGNYRVSDDWNLTGYASWGDSSYNVAHSTGYIMKAKDTNTSLGFGLKGKASDRLRLTADLVYTNDKVEYPQELDNSASAANVTFLAATGGVPDVSYKLLRFKLMGDYDLDKKSMVRVLLGYEQSKFNEWTWQWNGNAFRYSDNTTVYAKENQNVFFAGATYTYRW
ncbi:MAG: MtrB/PioB family decaheme-associated outer membrane protein [Betaproteobacteria bacterium]|nr:MtrB/PioB family decaheme-associated outer membrane protein [Betaproteobacteria bacterium]